MARALPAHGLRLSCRWPAPSFVRSSGLPSGGGKGRIGIDVSNPTRSYDNEQDGILRGGCGGRCGDYGRLPERLALLRQERMHEND
jgi:hypothetical protein